MPTTARLLHALLLAAALLGLGTWACSVANLPSQPSEQTTGTTTTTTTSTTTSSGGGGSGGSGVECTVPADCPGETCLNGVCVPLACGNGQQDGAETGVDCGGPDCGDCPNGQGCAGAGDCQSGICSAGLCVAFDCGDGLPNGSETGVDCGGNDCGPCPDGQGCGQASDCLSGICSAGLCAAFDCGDGLVNGDESDTDCGGSTCPGCTLFQICNGASDCAENLCVNGVCALDVTFSTCGATGAMGPTQAACDAGYAGTPLGNAVAVNAGIQSWVVPATGTYVIEVLGARGGNHSLGAGGLGARMQGELTLIQGQILLVLVGQSGLDGTYYDTSGGGGSFVALSDYTPLLVAGGGAGAGNCGPGDPFLQAGKAATGNGNGGTSGNDGSWCGCGGEGSGGGGYYGDGGGDGGRAFVNGGVGGTSTRPGQCVTVGPGGFGGGGNGGNGGGGGGGYEGGQAGGPSAPPGRGGLSFNAGTNQSNADGWQAGDGAVRIRSL